MERYNRNYPAISEEDQETLKSKTVTVIGCGGLGGYLINGAARLGVGKLRLVDCDVFSESNLNRQLFCNESNLGKSKAKEAAKAVAKINSGIQAEALDSMLTGENAYELLKGSDLVLDALDNIDGRLVAERACAKLGIYMIHGAAAGWLCQAGTIAPGSAFLEKIYPADFKAKPPAVLAFAPGFTANIQLAEMLKILLGKKADLEGKLLVADLEHMRFNTVEIVAQKKKKHGVSLMAGEIAEEIKNIDGFCTKKFKADFVTEGIDYSLLKAGDVLELEGRKIRITKVGKPCFEDCPVPKDKKPCALNRNVAFGEYAD